MRAPNYSRIDDELLSPAAIENPHPLYRRLRESAPLSRIGTSGVHIVANWALVEEALAREEDFSANLTGVLCRGEDGRPTCFDLPHTGSGAANVIATADEPRHAVHRALIQPRFTGKVAQMEARIRQWTRQSLMTLLSNGGGDVVPATERVPALVVAYLLGLPEADVDSFRIWAMMGGDILAGHIGEDTLVKLSREAGRMAHYLSEHFDRAAADLDPAPDAPLMHALAKGVSEQIISREEALGIAAVLFGAGGESTAALIGSCLKWLAQDQALADQIRGDLSLAPRFVEEVVRLETPFKFHYRVVRRDCQFGGFDLAVGDRLMLTWAAANRDPAMFEAAEEMRLDRKHPKQHMSYGRGAHFCIGAVLARLEARIVVEELLQATGTISLSQSAPAVYANSIFTRRLESLHLMTV